MLNIHLMPDASFYSFIKLGSKMMEKILGYGRSWSQPFNYSGTMPNSNFAFFTCSTSFLDWLFSYVYIYRSHQTRKGYTSFQFSRQSRNFVKSSHRNYLSAKLLSCSTHLVIHWREKKHKNFDRSRKNEEKKWLHGV